MATILSATITNSLARVVGQDEPAGLVLADAIRLRHAPVVARAQPHDDDYALIDPALAVAAAHDGVNVDNMPSGTGYAGMTPQQRGAFLAWLQEPNHPAPAAFQELYIAQLEVRLLEGGALGEDAHLGLRAMQTKEAWRGVDGVQRAILLGYWLGQDGAGLRDRLTQSPVSSRLFDRGLGLQALLDTPLTAAESAKIGQVWDLPALASQEPVLKMRIVSLTTSLKTDPLSYALNMSGQERARPRPWRSVHRDLRLSLPQPALRQQLEPLFADVAAIQLAEATKQEADDDWPATASEVGGVDASETLILEFGESRSEYFSYVLDLSQRLSGFSQLMDEDRHLVYRIRFNKGRLRTFWRIWDYVQNWSSTRIYVDGEEIERWKVWPYSQYLK